MSRPHSGFARAGRPQRSYCGAVTVILTDEDFPALWRSTDASSLDAQRRFLSATKIRLVALVAAAVGGAFVWRAGEFDLAGVIALLAFTVALGATVMISIDRSQQVWYEGRAAAESVRTLAWRYAVGGTPFPVTLSGREADALLIARMHDVMAGLEGLDVMPAVPGQQQITDAMRRVRALPLDERMAIYDSGRLEDQRRWYAARAASSGRAGRRWRVVTIALEFSGVVGAAAKAFGVVELDVLGVLGAGAAGVTGWAEAKKYDALRPAYFIASQELAAVRSELTAVTSESDWARFVQGGEEAISREHTLWRASRGVRSGR